MIGTYNYVLYTNDTTFSQGNWAKYLKAMDLIYGKVGPGGLLASLELEIALVSSKPSTIARYIWCRYCHSCVDRSNSPYSLYRTLLTGTDLSVLWGTSNLSENWTDRASALRTAINTYCLDNSYSAFKDNATTTELYSGDASNITALFNIFNSLTKSQSISNNSKKMGPNWCDLTRTSREHIPLYIQLRNCIALLNQ